MSAPSISRPLPPVEIGPMARRDMERDASRDITRYTDGADEASARTFALPADERADRARPRETVEARAGASRTPAARQRSSVERAEIGKEPETTAADAGGAERVASPAGSGVARKAMAAREARPDGEAAAVGSEAKTDPIATPIAPSLIIAQIAAPMGGMAAGASAGSGSGSAQISAGEAGAAVAPAAGAGGQAIQIAANTAQAAGTAMEAVAPSAKPAETAAQPAGGEAVQAQTQAQVQAPSEARAGGPTQGSAGSGVAASAMAGQAATAQMVQFGAAQMRSPDAGAAVEAGETAVAGAKPSVAGARTDAAAAKRPAASAGATTASASADKPGSGEAAAPLQLAGETVPVEKSGQAGGEAAAVTSVSAKAEGAVPEAGQAGVPPQQAAVPALPIVPPRQTVVLPEFDPAAQPSQTHQAGAADAGRATPLHVVPVEIGMRALAGNRQFDIRLDPGELGRVDVRLDISDDGEVNARLTVDRVETLHLLQRDARTLERAFEQAGLKTSEGGVQISLRDPSDQSGARQGGQRDDAPARNHRIWAASGDETSAITPVETQPVRRVARLGGVDLSI